MCAKDASMCANAAAMCAMDAAICAEDAATCGDDAGYVPRNYLVPETLPEMPYESESTATAISASAFYRM